MLYMKVVNRINPKNSHHKGKIFFFSSFVSMRRQMFTKTIVTHFMMFVRQIIRLYTLILYRSVCQF